jgi:hypothetical protein
MFVTLAILCWECLVRHLVSAFSTPWLDIGNTVPPTRAVGAVE